ncbi:hypothetical protein LY625_03670 [Lysobacter sp. GX 14042]|uniref:hypothetical protein n=1 Tax=Lysobacter sp. GX 14042 TaxID=2907155 RepID=UPI001F3CCCE5|nr:hypothetical protein [Lysobacter sp. GX 14042]MCE7031723.1 hypothetical protein [Lysobacter sp. GX 14042]
MHVPSGLTAPPAPPIPHIPGLGTPGTQPSGHPVQQALNTLGGLLPGGGPVATAQSAVNALPVALPGTPAFTGGPGQPALPALQGPLHNGGARSAMGNPATGYPLAGQPGPASLAGAVVSQLARAMNHGAPHSAAQANTQGGPAPAGSMFASVPGSPGLVAHSPATALPLPAHPAAHRATDAPLVPRMPAQQGFQASVVPRAVAQPTPAHAQPAALSQAPATPGQAPAAAHQAAQAASQPQAGTAPAQENRLAQQQAQVPGRAAQAGQPATMAAQAAVSGNPAAPSTAAANPASAAAINQAAVPLVAALAGNTMVEARAVQGAGNERSQVHLENALASGHTAERGLRRSLRNRVSGMRSSLLRMIGLSLLDPAHRQRPHGHTAQGADVVVGKGVWFALPWLFWLLSVVAYGCLAMALVVMIGADAAGPTGTRAAVPGWLGPLVLGCGLLAALGAWRMVRRRR